MIVANNTEILYEQCKGRKVYIYGAKTIAQRVCYYLESRGIQTEAFLVSNRYENPDSLQGKPVLRIEDSDRKYDCVVVAVNGSIVWKVEQEIEQYNIKNIVVISPLLDDAFPACYILSNKSNISDKAFLSDNIQLIADETSSIVIEDNATIESGTVILATGGANVHICKCCNIGEKVVILASENSNIELGEYSAVNDKGKIIIKENSVFQTKYKAFIDEYTQISVAKSSEIRIGYETYIGRNCRFISEYNSNIFSGGRNTILSNGIIAASDYGQINIGKLTTINGNLYMDARNSEISIGTDCMLSYYIKINVGSHMIVDQLTHREITNYNKIVVSDHVWIGMGVTLLPGCKIGSGSVVGASTLVNKSIPMNVTCVGIPARIVKTGIEWDRNEHNEY